jgi:hypothetical protein
MMGAETPETIKQNHMETKLSMAIASHLSDAQHEILTGEIKLATKRLNFVKLITFKHSDLNEYVTFDYLTTLWNQL